MAQHATSQYKHTIAMVQRPYEQVQVCRHEDTKGDKIQVDTKHTHKDKYNGAKGNQITQA